jgi:hypothetical protein
MLRFQGFFTPTTVHIAKMLSMRSEYLKTLQSDFALFSKTLRTVYFYEELQMRTRIVSIQARVEL